MANTAAIALGSNLASIFGDREATIHEAVSRIADNGTILAVSPYYDTEPVGYHDQPRFLNAALLLETTLEPLPLLRMLLATEKAMGRDRSHALANGPRPIDLDLLLVGGFTLQSHELVLPHPRMHERRFVLQPLAYIAPELRHPLTGQTIAEMLASLPAW